MMKILQITMFSLGAFIAVNCQNSSDDKKGDEGIEIIQDNTFEKGFVLRPLNTNYGPGDHSSTRTIQQEDGFKTLNFGRDGSVPIWRIAQSYSKFNLAHAEFITGNDGSLHYVTEEGSKKVTLYPDNSLLLEVNASKEYDSPRVKGQGWPHLLISQNFNGNSPHADIISQNFNGISPNESIISENFDENSPNVGKAKQLLFSIELKLEKEENKMDQGTFNASLHTAQSPLYFVVRNGNKNSPDFNQRLWFGIRSYDYRWTEMRDTENIQWDIGTSQYMYQVPPRSIWGEISFQDKKWHKGEADLKPLIIRALEAMREKDVFMETTPDDLVITGMNFGWEVTGTFDVAIKVKGISLKYIE